MLEFEKKWQVELCEIARFCLQSFAMQTSASASFRFQLKVSAPFSPRFRVVDEHDGVEDASHPGIWTLMSKVKSKHTDSRKIPMDQAKRIA